MAQSRPPWFVRQDWQLCDYAFFVSHVNDDREEIHQLKAEIEAYSGRGGAAPLRCFLDLHNWEIGNLNTAVIRDYLLRSTHMVAWITRNYLNNPRGWVWVELAYAQVIELSNNLASFDLRRPYVVPIFRDVDVRDIERTPLLEYWQRRLGSEADVDVRQIARKLVDFYEQELRKRGKT